MPNIRSMSDLTNNSNEIRDFCKETREPVFITKNGIGDMVLMDIETYEKQQTQLELYAKLGEAELEIVNGDTGENFFEFAKKLKKDIHGNV